MSRLTLMSNEELSGLPLDQKVSFIAKTSQMVIEEPEKNLGHLQSLLRLLRDSEFVVVKLTAVSLGEVFRNIVPLYKIEAPAEGQRGQTLKKEERQLQSFEAELLSFYERFFRTMDEVRQALSGLTREFLGPAGGVAGSQAAVQRRPRFGLLPALRETELLQPRERDPRLHSQLLAR